jgi:hypothetical protein
MFHSFICLVLLTFVSGRDGAARDARHRYYASNCVPRGRRNGVPAGQSSAATRLSTVSLSLSFDFDICALDAPTLSL